MSKEIQGNVDARQLKDASRQGNEPVLLTWEGSASPLTGAFIVVGPEGGAKEGSSSGTIEVQNNGTTIGSESILNFIAGTGVIITITDSGGKINITIGLGSSGGGSGAFAIVESPGYSFVW